MINTFKNPSKSPYDLKKEDFVENIDFEFKILSSKDIQSDIPSSNYFMKLIEKFLFLKKLPIVTLGNYGMGKSTIAKYLSILAIEKEILPIFIELRNLDIETIELDTIHDFTQSIIDIAFKKYTINENLNELIMEYFYKKQVVVILDGVDEAIIQNNKVLSKFIEFIISSKLPIYISCRLEYANFISLYNSKISYGNFVHEEHLNIVLKNWDIKQWKSYEKKLMKKDEFKEVHQDIKVFFTDVYNHKFGDIPQRPLFLKMLTKLKIERDRLGRSGNAHYTLIETLSSNRSEIYYKYIRWQLINDLFKHESNEYIDKDGILNTKINKIIDAFIELLSLIAVYMYHKSLTDGVSSIMLDDILDKLIIKLDNRKKRYLTEEFVEKALDETSLFAILQRDNQNTSFIFSHKSFMEYLVSYRLAKSIFTNKPKCDEVWGYYQTHEVSQHFMFEVQRVVITKWLEKYSSDKKIELKILDSKTEEYRNEFLAKAFTDVLLYSLYEKKIDTLYYNHLDFDSEKFEEALFYIGRFKLKHNKNVLIILQNIFDDMENDGNNYHPVYYRTVSLALAQIKGIDYCNKYVEFLLEDYKTPSRKHYQINLDIQKNYYGKNELMLNKLSIYINQFLKENNIQRDIIANDILTYFSSYKSDKNNYQIRNEYMEKIIDKTKKMNQPRLTKICLNIQKLFIAY